MSFLKNDQVIFELLPLCVDLDGTLIRTDVLTESLLIFFKKYPWKVFYLLFWLLQGRAILKAKVASFVDLNLSILPVNQKIIDLILHFKQKGHKIYLVTAAAQKYGEKAGTYFNFFDGVLTSTLKTNLRSEAKAKILVERFGNQGFIYAGNSSADIKVWKKSAEIIAINISKSIFNKIKKFGKPIIVLKEKENLLLGLWQAMYPKFWILNCLIYFSTFNKYYINNNFKFVQKEKEFLNFFSCFDLMKRNILPLLSFIFLSSGLHIFADLMNLSKRRLNRYDRTRPVPFGTLIINRACQACFLLIITGLYTAHIANFKLGLLINQIFYISLLFCINYFSKQKF